MDASDFIDRNFSQDTHYFAIPEDADGFTIKQQRFLLLCSSCLTSPCTCGGYEADASSDDASYAGLPMLPTPISPSDGAGISHDGLLSSTAPSHMDSDTPLTFKWVMNGDTCDVNGNWFWSQEALSLAGEDGYLIKGDWFYASGRNGSIDSEF